MTLRRLLPVAVATAMIVTAVPPAFAGTSGAGPTPARRPVHGTMRSEIVVVLDRPATPTRTGQASVTAV